VSEQDIKKIIVEEFKAEGLEIAEDVAVRIVKVAFKAIPKIVDATENQVDDYLKPLLSLVEKPVMAALDKIDGHVG
jgi:hydroxymethylpyrimidine/phosphomethylpyrimidine kinase